MVKRVLFLVLASLPSTRGISLVSFQCQLRSWVGPLTTPRSLSGEAFRFPIQGTWAMAHSPGALTP